MTVEVSLEVIANVSLRDIIQFIRFTTVWKKVSIKNFLSLAYSSLELSFLISLDPIDL